METSDRDSAPDWLGIFPEEAADPSSTDARPPHERGLDSSPPRAANLNARSFPRDLRAITEHATRARRRVESILGPFILGTMFVSGILVGGLLVLAVRAIPSVSTTQAPHAKITAALAEATPVSAGRGFAGPSPVHTARAFAGPPVEAASAIAKQGTLAPESVVVAASGSQAKQTVVAARPRRPPATPAPSRNRIARNVRHRGSLAVASQPDGASVFLNGQLAGKTPLVLRNIAVGSRAVRVVKSGYRPWSGVVRIVGNRRASVKATLEYAPMSDGDAPPDEVASRMR